jgi:hypothetical protein
MPTYVSPFTGDVIQPTDVSYAAYTLTTNIQLEWPSNVNQTEYPAARIMDITPATGHLSMPPANQVSVGQDSLIRNLGGISFDVLDNDGGTIVAVPAGKSVYIYVTDNGTAAGVWGVIDFGAGTSGGTAAELAGLGLLAISTTLNQSHPTTLIVDGYTFVANDRAQTKIWDGGAGSAYLPLASTVGDNWFTLFKNNGSGTLTIFTQGSDLLNNAVSKTFQPDEDAFIICDGTNYITVGYGSSSNFFFTALIKPVTSGDVFLTTSEATSVIQEYVGNLTGDVLVYYPPVIALYVISNQTTDNGYTLTITTGVSGGANVVVPPGNQVSVISDGVNFFNANTVQAGGTIITLLDGTQTTPSLSFLSETTTGLYRPAAGHLGITVLGTKAVDISGSILDATSLNIKTTGTGNFQGGISGGTFN